MIEKFHIVSEFTFHTPLSGTCRIVLSMRCLVSGRRINHMEPDLLNMVYVSTLVFSFD